MSLSVNIEGGQLLMIATVHDGVEKTKRGKIWIPKDKTREFIEHTHKTLCQKFDMENLKQNINDLITSC